MSFHEKLQELIYLLDEWLDTPITEKERAQWAYNAEQIAYTYEFSEHEQAYVEQMIDMYDEQFEYMQTLSAVQPEKQYLDELLSRTQTEQRTDAWYKQMSSIISASELGNLFGSAYQRSKFVVSKTQPYQQRQQDLALPSARMSAFDWGIRFEPVVKQIYQAKYGCDIRDLGRLIHPQDPRCAASPDGLIYDCPEQKRTGRLIEIKCPVSRQIDGTIPKDYYNQMQMQLHVTGLELCEYVESVFASPYNTMQMKEGPGLYHGFIALVRRAEPVAGQEFYYIYSPVNCDACWTPIIDSEEDLIELTPWTLMEWSEQTVQRSEEWWKKTHALIDEFWRDVELHKRGEFTVLESNRPVKKQKAEEKCMITFTRLDYP
jgi:hypothetical protein